MLGGRVQMLTVPRLDSRWKGSRRQERSGRRWRRQLAPPSRYCHPPLGWISRLDSLPTRVPLTPACRRPPSPLPQASLAASPWPLGLEALRLEYLSLLEAEREEARTWTGAVREILAKRERNPGLWEGGKEGGRWLLTEEEMEEERTGLTQAVEASKPLIW